MSTTQVRLSVTLSGGASLGAYQAGALASLIEATIALRKREADSIAVGAIGGASAGALIALLGAHALRSGLNPTRLLYDAWVEKVSLSLLTGSGPDSPMSHQRLREGLRELLLERERGDDHTDHGPIAVHISLTGLQGLSYQIESMHPDGPVPGVTYTDWGRVVLGPEGSAADLFEPEGASPIDLVLASAANPGTFAPQLLDRSGDRETYQARGITNFPDSGQIWYTDGGLLQAQPLGRVLAAAESVLSGDTDSIHRVNVLIDPRSEGPSGSGRWTDPDEGPSWIEGLARALAIVPAQALYEDMRGIAKDNTRLKWAAMIADALGPHLHERAVGQLQDVLGEIEREKADLRTEQPDVDRRADTDRSSGSELLRRAIEEVAGLAGKDHVDIDIISHRDLADESDDVPTLLAGEFMGDFGGFLDARIRRSDFLLGWASTRSWLPGALDQAGFSEETIRETLDRVDGRSPGDWRDENLGEIGVSDLPRASKLELARFGIHAVRVLMSTFKPSALSVGKTIEDARRRIREAIGRNDRS